MPEKKCFNCENMDFCAMHQGLMNIGSLSVNLVKDRNGDWPFVYISNLIALHCKRFRAIKEGA